MKYIVYREKFKSYDLPQGNGYFVKYKDKLHDEYSPNWHDAGKYKSIGPALTRLGIALVPGMDTIDKFLAVLSNKQTTGRKRNSILSGILNESISSAYSFEKGHVDKISDTGEFLGSADEEVTEYINNYIKKNKARNDKKLKAIGIDGESKGYILETKEGEDFWDGF